MKYKYIVFNKFYVNQSKRQCVNRINHAVLLTHKYARVQLNFYTKSISSQTEKVCVCFKKR